jgi:peroxiredoxin
MYRRVPFEAAEESPRDAGRGNQLFVVPVVFHPLLDDARHTHTRPSMPSSVPPVGAAAPDFTLASTSGKPLTLSSLRGRNVLLAFFPLAFTSTCTAELCDMRDDWDQFGDADTVVLPISVDSTASLGEFKNKYAMKSDLLSDFKREVSRQYGVLIEDRFFSTRAYFLIDREGMIRWEHVESNPSNKRSNDELLQEIRKLS